MDATLRRLIDDEYATMREVADAGAQVLTEIRHEWSEAVDREHTAWRRYSEALLKASQRATIWGRPGLKLRVDEGQPFALQPLRQVDGAFIEAALKALIPGYPSADIWRIAMDGQYYLLQPDDFAKIVGWDWLDAKPWIADRFDCDDFAFAFKGRLAEIWMVNSVGLVIDWSSTHAYNITVLADGRAMLYEPQDDTIPDIGKGIHKLRQAAILI